MGILTKIAATDISKRIETKKPATEIQPGKSNDPEIPAARCPICVAAGRAVQYGHHFWLDPYGSWNCTECRPPVSMAQVRREVLLPPTRSEGPDGGPAMNSLDTTISAGDSEIMAGVWRQAPDGEGRWGLERIGPDGEFATGERRRWWATVGWEGLAAV